MRKKTFGTLTGKLIYRRKRFFLYPCIDAKVVELYFGVLEEHIDPFINHMVQVSGLNFYRSGREHPVSCDVVDIKLLSDEEEALMATVKENVARTIYENKWRDWDYRMRKRTYIPTAPLRDQGFWGKVLAILVKLWKKLKEKA